MAYPIFKKTYFYKFLPIKLEEEEEFQSNSHLQRTLVVIRDVYPLSSMDPYSPWQIKKLLSHYEVASDKIILSFADTFDHILRYWNLFMANNVAVLGRKVSVVMWDVTDERNPKKYEGSDVFFQMTPNREHGILSCTEVMRNRKLKVNDYIGIYWDSRDSSFHFKLLFTSAV